MCGILGHLGRPITRAAFQAALDRLAHRGPDGEGLHEAFHDGSQLLLGHRRLAILDLSPAGAQPMHSADGRYSMVFNGEIYNYRALRAGLEREGVRFRSQTDSEVLLELFARRGPAIFATLNGMFALAIYDQATGELVVARDHLGVKPFYYSLENGALCFASEIKAMLALGLKARLKRELLGEYLAQMWIQEPDTLFEGIFKLPAGHWGRYANGQLELKAFWDLSPEQLHSRASAPFDQLRALLEEAVQLQLIADRPVGAYISGGVDSSTITHIAAHEVQELIAVSSRFAQSDQRFEGLADDGFWADRFAREHPSLHYHSAVLSPDLYGQYKDLVYHVDEPIADPAIGPAYLLAKQAREAGAVVMLSGMGGDELFGGYSRYAAVQLMAAANQVPTAARGALLSVANGMQAISSGPLKRRINHAQRFCQSTLEPWPLTYVNLLGHYSPQEIDVLAGPNWREPYQHKLQAVLAGFEEASPLTQAQRLDLKGFLASHNLIYSDKASMAASVEVRVPFLDYRLAEFAFSLPDALRATHAEEKVLLKQLCASLVGPGYAYRKKAGFAMPVRSWLQGALRPEVGRVLTQGRVAALFDRPVLQRLLDDHDHGRLENTWKLWTLLTLDTWLERFEVAA